MSFKKIAVAVALLAAPLSAANAAEFRRGDAVQPRRLRRGSEGRRANPGAHHRLVVHDLRGAEADHRQADVRPALQGPADVQHRFRQPEEARPASSAPRMQSTLIVFKGNKEAGRSSGETDPKAIGALLEKAV